MTLTEKKISSRIGDIFLTASPNGLRGVFWRNIHPESTIIPCRSSTEILKQAEKQITEYLEGVRKSFDLPLDLTGTDFQKRVWETLLKIPYGSTRSYKDIALATGNPGASRAVGTANRKNPICLIIPCHRVVARNGSLGGYSGGPDLKQKLLDLELAQVHQSCRGGHGQRLPPDHRLP